MLEPPVYAFVVIAVHVIVIWVVLTVVATGAFINVGVLVGIV